MTNDLIDNIYNIDCFDGIKNIDNNSIDMVLTDPPYEISRKSGFASGEPSGTDVDRFRISIDFGEWDQNGSFDIDLWANECYRVLKNGGYLVCFYDLWKITELANALKNSGFKQLRFIEWVKTNPVPINSKINYLTNAREIAVCAIKGSNCVFNSEYDNGIYSYPICHDKGRFHPTQKPLELICDILKKHTNENDVVLDTCAGSGTTGIACLKNNRHFICFELDPNYYTKAKERIKKQKSKRKLF